MSEQGKDKPGARGSRPARPEDKGDGGRPGGSVGDIRPGAGGPADDDVRPADGVGIDLPEPKLGKAEISEDVAKTTSLEQVEAEAEAVAHEAEAAGTLVAGRDAAAGTPGTTRGNLTAGASPAGPAPAAGGAPVAGQGPGTEQLPVVNGATVGGDVPPRAWVPPQPAFGTPTAAAPEPGERRRRAQAGNRRGKALGRNSLPLIGGAAVVALVLVGLLIWLIVSLVGGANQSASSSGAPQDWKQGDCLKGFTDAGHPASVVPCDSGHSAQLVGTYFYPADTAYPGADALKAKAQDVCGGVKLDTAADKYSLKQFTAYPSENAWNNKDRRVDCIVSDPDGDKITESLIK